MACLPCWLDRLRYLAGLPANANTALRDEADERPQHHPTAGRHMDGAAAEPHHRRHIFQESIATMVSAAGAAPSRRARVDRSQHFSGRLSTTSIAREAESRKA